MNEIKSENQVWQWTDFGVLSNKEGVAILDVDNWNINPEDAVLIQSAPVMLTALQNVKALIENGAFEQREKALSIIDSAVDAATKITKT
jgi:hypothetical protein